MWTKPANRRDLIDILQPERSAEPSGLFSRYDFSATSSLSSPRPRDGWLLVWQEDPRDFLILPNLIIVPETEQREFFAWAATYLSGLRPLTAYIRVGSYETAERALRMQSPPNLHRLENACIGLMLGETATYLNGQRDLSDLTVRACATTYSFAMARTLALKLTHEFDRLSDAWFLARKLSRQSDLSLDFAVLRRAWIVLLGLENGTFVSGSNEPQLPSAILQACLDLYMKGAVDQRQWIALESDVPGIADVVETMRGPREDRVLALEEIASRLRMHHSENSPSPAFVVGYLASQVAPGTLDHMHLLTPHVHKLPGVLLWYGLCAGLHRRSTVGLYASGLGRRAIRDVLRNENLLDRPSCDIALPELEAVSSNGHVMPDFRTASHNQMDVEIAPCVTSTFRWPPRSASPDSLFSARLSADELRNIKFGLDNVADQVREISLRVGKIAAVGNDEILQRAGRKQRRR